MPKETIADSANKLSESKASEMLEPASESKEAPTLQYDETEDAEEELPEAWSGGTAAPAPEVQDVPTSEDAEDELPGERADAATVSAAASQ